MATVLQLVSTVCTILSTVIIVLLVSVSVLSIYVIIEEANEYMLQTITVGRITYHLSIDLGISF